MENVYQLFFSGKNGAGDFNSFYTPQKTTKSVAQGLVKDNMPSVTKNNIDNYFDNSNNPKAKKMPGTSNEFGNLSTIPGKFQDTAFANFDSHSFMNSTQKKVPEKNYSPAVLQMQMLGEKIRNLENKHKEEKNKLLDIIQQNVINNKQKAEDPRAKRREAVKEKLARIKKKMGVLDPEDSEEEKAENKTSINKSVLDQPVEKKNSIAQMPKPITPVQPKPSLLKDDNTALMNTLQEIREEIALQLQEQSLQNDEKFTEMGINFRKLKNEISNKLDYMDHKQKLQLENLRFVLDHSGVPRMKKLTRKVFDGIDFDEEEEVKNIQEEKKVVEVEEKKIEIPKRRRHAQVINLPEEEPDEDFSDLVNYMEEKRKYNALLADDLEQQEKEENPDNRVEELKQEKIKGLKEKLQDKQRNQNRLLDLKAEKYKKKPYEIKPINNLRKYVYTVIAANKILNLGFDIKKTITHQTLTFFINYYESMNKALKDWIFTCIRTPYLNILNSPNLYLDLSSYVPKSKTVPKDIESTYIRLETRVLGFIKILGEQESFHKMDQNLINYLSVLITNNTFVPKEFFTLFEYSRLTTENSEIINLNENQMHMILGVYIICKILCKDILIDQIFSEGSVTATRTKYNYKMCGSVLYYYMIEYIKKLCPVLRKIDKMENFSDASKNTLTKKYLYETDKKKNPNGPISKSYKDSCLKYAKQNKQYMGVMSASDQKTLKKIITKIPKYQPDTNDQDIEGISRLMYSQTKLQGFNSIALNNKFELENLLVDFLNKLINVLDVRK